MTTKHTPGPWSLAYNEDGSLQLGGNGELHTSVFSESGFGIVAQVMFKKTRILGDSIKLQEQTFNANARLIAAAPELLEALRSLENRLTSLANSAKTPLWVTSRIYELLMDLKISEVVTKATGGGVTSPPIS
jgi:hypothetical protein